MGWGHGDVGSQRVPCHVPRGLLLVVSSTCRGDSSLLVLSGSVCWSLALDFAGVEAARCVFVISALYVFHDET